MLWYGYMATLLTHRDHEDRPWGSFDRFTKNEPSTVKLIRINPNQEFSLQYHKHRNEFWHVIHGGAVATIGEEKREIKEGDEIQLPEGTKHRLHAGPEGVMILEIAFGEFDEGDIVRLADDYGRVPSP